MYFQFFVYGITKGDLGWILSKHPEHNFEKEKGRINGSWISKKVKTSKNIISEDGKEIIVEEEVEVVGYQVFIKNDPLQFILMMRGLNTANYVHSQLSAVCPYNFSAWKEVFSSAISNRFDSQCLRHNDLFKIEAVCGPWAGDPNNVIIRFSEGNINVTSIDSCDTLLPNSKLTRTLKFETQNLMTVSEFLQKMYVFSYMVTNRINAQGDDKFTVGNYAIRWLHTLSTRTRWYLAHRTTPEKKKELQALGQKHRDEQALESKDNKEEKDKEKKEEEEKEEEVEGKEDKTSDEQEEADNDENNNNKSEGLHKPQGLREEEVLIVGRKSLHQIRHEIILQYLKDKWFPATSTSPSPEPSFIDFGCSSGKLTIELRTLFPNSKILALDADSRRFSSLQKKKISTSRCNLLLPPIRNMQKFNDVFVGCEIIEHFETFGRKRVIEEIIGKLLKPKYIIITTPNYEYNISIYENQNNITLTENQKQEMLRDRKFPYRHPGHKIEYLKTDWIREVINPLRSFGYKLNEINLFENVDIQPSFVVFAERCEENNNIKNKSNETDISLDILGMTEPFYLHHNQRIVSSRILNAGYTTQDFIEGGEQMMYLSPTIAPVEWKEGKYSNYVEHLSSAFDYYKTRGLQSVTVEKKYMGSRGQLLIFRNNDVCPPGYSLIKLLSRSGKDFFSNSYLKDHGDMVNTLLNKWQIEMSKKLEQLNLDWVFLDGEVLPWKAKAGGLVNSDFTVPGECALMTRKICFGEKSEETENAEKFMNVLQWFTDDQNDNIEFCMFHLLAAGKVESKNNNKNKKNKKKKYRDDKEAQMGVCYVGTAMEIKKKYSVMKDLECDGIKMVEYDIIDLDSDQQQLDCIKKWDEYCMKGGEGFVVKSCPSLMEKDLTGRMIVPCLKVRGKEYLRLVYGIDYLKKECFEEVKKRNVAAKRALSAVQSELADAVLKCWLNGFAREKVKYVGAFYGEEKVKIINATL